MRTESQSKCKKEGSKRRKMLGCRWDLQRERKQKPVYESVYGYDGSKNHLERYAGWCWNKLHIYFLTPLISFYILFNFLCFA